jgi:hypothetical protein
VGAEGKKEEIKREKSKTKNKRRKEDSIYKKTRAKAYAGVDWVHLAQDKKQWRAFANTTGGKFLMHQSDHLLKKNSVPWS